ncbi:MAG: metal-dependent phosphohydrolase [Nostocaceae cyanobacterium]|nr:metal-dependent phosphohydrolase [Nostocaceae cyanobacterium]
MIKQSVESLVDGYRQTYDRLNSDYADLMGWVAFTTLSAIARSDAPYHDLEHTVLVTLVGQEILRGKQIMEGGVSPRAWLHFIISLLCHDIGYIKGICRDDWTPERLYTTGVDNHMIVLSSKATDASLTPYHVDRSKQFVAEKFARERLINIELIKHNIELTRFPVPNDAEHSDTLNYPGLARAADLIGQLGDTNYLDKIPALFSEFEETGANQKLGYRHPQDVRASYPKFYRHTVYPLIQEGLEYLRATLQGNQIISSLYANVRKVEQENQLSTAIAC